MLLGAVLTVHTDHKNLTHRTDANQRVIRQLNYLEHFGPTYVHIAGDKNFLADMFSRLPRRDDIPQEKESSSSGSEFEFELELRHLTLDCWHSSSMFDHLDDPDVFECFLNLPDTGDDIPLALDYLRLSQDQLLDPHLLRNQIQHPTQFPNQ